LFATGSFLPISYGRESTLTGPPTLYEADIALNSTVRYGNLKLSADTDRSLVAKAWTAATALA
jgi:hypothetical protein